MNPRPGKNPPNPIPIQTKYPYPRAYLYPYLPNALQAQQSYRYRARPILVPMPYGEDFQAPTQNQTM